MTMTSTESVKRIKAVLGFTKMFDVELLKRLDAIRDGMTGNAAFLNPPVDMAVFTTAVETFNALIHVWSPSTRPVIRSFSSAPNYM